jgi:hypothetical protein
LYRNDVYYYISTMTERLEEERSKIIARLNGQEGSKCRPRLFFELAGIEARLGHNDDAIYALRDAIANGLDVAYAEELQISEYFESLDPLPAFQTLLSSFQGEQVPFQFIYAKGEKERCDETLLCLICNDPLVDPMVHSECGNVYCSQCISPHTTCPQCNTATTNITKLGYRLILNKLNGLRAHCPRCQNVFERSALNVHIQNCPVLCPHSCQLKIAPAALEEHALICTAVVVPCSGHDVQCQWKGMRRDLANHAARCTYIKNRPLLRRMAALEEANRSLEAKCQTLQTRVDKLEGAENDSQSNENPTD